MQQQPLLSVGDYEKIQAIQAATFTKRAKALPALDADTIQSITDLANTGPWSRQQKSDLALALCESLSGSASSAPTKQEQRSVQELRHFQNYFADPAKPMVAKLETAVNRLSHLGCVLLSCQTIKHILRVILAASGHHTTDPVKIRSWYLELRDAIRCRFRNCKEPGAVGYIIKFPEHPKYMDETARKIAYAGGPAVDMAVASASIEAVGRLIAMRKNSQLLQSARVPGVPQQDQALASSAGPADPMQAFMSSSLLQACMRQMSLQCAQQPPAPHIKFFDRQCASPVATPQPLQPSGFSQRAALRLTDKLPNDIPPKDNTVEQGSPEEQAHRFMKALGQNGSATGNGDDDEEDPEDDTGTMPTASAKGAGCAKAKAAGRAKPTAKGSAGKTKGAGCAKAAAKRPAGKTKAACSPKAADKDSASKTNADCAKKRPAAALSMVELVLGCSRCRWGKG